MSALVIEAIDGRSPSWFRWSAPSPRAQPWVCRGPATLTDPAASAGLFYTALARIPGWEQLPVTVAAQTVQRSTYPTAYADDEPLALRLLADLGGGIDGAVPGDIPGCTGASAIGAADVAGGRVRFPLRAGSGYVDQRNFASTGRWWASTHTGTDLSVRRGTPVLAATGGTARIVRDQAWAGPWLVQTSTGVGRLTTWYAHLRRIDVHDGATVAVGGPGR